MTSRSRSVARRLVACLSQFAEREGLLRVDVLLLATLLAGAFVTGVGFFFGKVCSPWTLRVLFPSVFLCALILSPKRALAFLGFSCAALLLTCFTYPYVGSDVANYHLPMQCLLIDGWNPVFDSTLEKFSRVAGDSGFSHVHALFLPKFHSLCGALVALAAGLCVGDSFLNYVLLLALSAASFRLSREIFGCGRSLSAVFSACCALSVKLSSAFDGHVEYVMYSAFATMLFSAALWRRSRLFGDLAMFAMSAAACALSKTNGLVNVVLVCLVLLPLEWRSKSFRRSMLVLGALVLVVGAHPLLTNWIQYGSPFYPTMTFDPNVAVMDITNDFASNADGSRMGYLARIVYAWVSKPLAVKACAWYYGQPGFSPAFHVVGGVGGYGHVFSLMLALSLLACILSKRNVVTAMIVLIFVTSNFAPLKYIGYSRYFLQIRLIPLLAAFNLLAFPNALCLRLGTAFHRAASSAFVFAVVGCCFLLILRSASGALRLLATESVRQAELRRMSAESRVWKVPAEAPGRYALRKVAGFNGVDLRCEGDFPEASATSDPLLLSSGDVRKAVDEINRRYPFGGSISQLMHFDWLGGASAAFKVRPNFRAEGGMR